MARSVQYSLLRFPNQHGGELAKGKRKTARPLATKRAMHIVFRARTRGMQSHASAIRAMQSRLAKRYEIQIYESSNNDNHLHQVIRGRTRRGLQNYFRVFAGHVAQLVTGAKKGKKSIKGFWLNAVWTRILEWRKDFQTACAYVLQNQLEAAGLIPYTPRKSRTRRGRPSGPVRGPSEPARQGRSR